MAISVSSLSRAVKRRLAAKGIHLPAGKSKYSAKRCWLDESTGTLYYAKREAPAGAVHFDSKSEAIHWLRLVQLQRLGQIRNLQRQVKFPLCAPSLHGGSEVVAHWSADFVFTDVATGERIVQDRKSPATRTAVYQLKKRWMKIQHGITIVEV